MRSGDVHRPDRPPTAGEHWSQPVLNRFDWDDSMTPEAIMELGTTRSVLSSFHRRGAGTKCKRICAGYLYEHLGFEPHSTVKLPYFTLVWVADQAE